MIALVVILFHSMGLLSSIHAIQTTRTEQGAIAWAVSLNTIPYVAVPAYWFLGRSRFEGYVTARRSEMEEIDNLSESAKEAVREFLLPPSNITPAAQAAQRLAGIDILQGNSLELLVDGDSTFTSILDGIDAAENYILFQFFIVKDDESAAEIKQRLVEGPREASSVTFSTTRWGVTTYQCRTRRNFVRLGWR